MFSYKMLQMMFRVVHLNLFYFFLCGFASLLEPKSYIGDANTPKRDQRYF